jgi:hypothetical protein
MLEAETSSLIESMHDRITLGRAVVTLKDILAADIPSAVQCIIRCGVETKLQDEQQRLFAESEFNYSHPDVHHLREQMNSSLVLHYTFAGDHLRTVLEERLGLLLRYLVRPEETLRSVVFEFGQVASVGALEIHLRSFEPYDYLRTILRLYLHERAVTSIGADRFAKLLRGIDAEYVRRKTGDQLARMLTPLATLLARNGTETFALLPVDTLIEFFYDKGLLAICVKLENIRNDGTFSLTLAELSDILESVRQATGEFKTDDKIPKNGAHQKPAAAREPAVVPPPPDPEPPPTGQPRIITDQPRIITIEDADKRRFMRKLFGGDEVAYDAALRQLSATGNWKEASRAIDTIFIANKIYPYTADAKRFVKILSEQFTR